MPAMVSTLLAAVFAGILLHMQGGVDAIQAWAPAVIGGSGDQEFCLCANTPPKNMCADVASGEGYTLESCREETQNHGANTFNLGGTQQCWMMNCPDDFPFVEASPGARDVLQHQGEECWEPCTSSGHRGYCDWCGEGYSCCRQDNVGISDPAECNGVKVSTWPGKQMHSCVEGVRTYNKACCQKTSSTTPGPADSGDASEILQGLLDAHGKTKEAEAEVETLSAELKADKKIAQDKDNIFTEAMDKAAAEVSQASGLTLTQLDSGLFQLSNSNDKAIGSASSSFTQQQTDAMGRTGDASETLQDLVDAHEAAKAADKKVEDTSAELKADKKISQDKHDNFTEAMDKAAAEVSQASGLTLTQLDSGLFQLSNSNDKAIGSASSSFTQQQTDAMGRKGSGDPAETLQGLVDAHNAAKAADKKVEDTSAELKVAKENERELDDNFTEAVRAAEGSAGDAEPKDSGLLQLKNSNDKAIGSASSSFTQQQPDAIGSASSSFTQQQQQQQPDATLAAPDAARLDRAASPATPAAPDAAVPAPAAPPAIGSASSSFTQQQQPDATPAAPNAARADSAASPATPPSPDAALPAPAAPPATGKRLMRSEGKPAVETAQDVQPHAPEAQRAAVLEVGAEDRMTAEARQPTSNQTGDAQTGEKTGGTCRYFGCDSSRNAECDTAGNCVCGNGTRNKDGACIQEGAEPTTAEPTTAEQTAAPQPEAPAPSGEDAAPKPEPEAAPEALAAVEEAGAAASMLQIDQKPKEKPVAKAKAVRGKKPAKAGPKTESQPKAEGSRSGKKVGKA